MSCPKGILREVQVDHSSSEESGLERGHVVGSHRYLVREGLRVETRQFHSTSKALLAAPQRKGFAFYHSLRTSNDTVSGADTSAVHSAL